MYLYLVWEIIKTVKKIKWWQGLWFKCEYMYTCGEILNIHHCFYAFLMRSEQLRTNQIIMKSANDLLAMTRIINIGVYEACPYLNWHGRVVNLAKNSTEVNPEQFEGKLYNRYSSKKGGNIFEPFVALFLPLFMFQEALNWRRHLPTWTLMWKASDKAETLWNSKSKSGGNS